MAADSHSHLGKYQLVGIVGEGAMGVVHRAFDPVLNRTLAIKVMSSVIASDAQLRERFLREARAAGSLQHPNVITIYDFGEIADHLFIAMEFVEGNDLAEIIKKRTPLSVEAKLDILIDTLNGLGYAHSHGVVHRDIKPANIRVTAEGRAKLMDFGIAHMQASDLTKSGEMIGTPQYMAPEQVTGDPITAAADIFSLGCVGYEFFSNVRPFDGETLHAILFNIVSHEPLLLTELVPALPSDLDDIFSIALMKDPKARFESAAAMTKALLLVRQSLSPTSDHASLVLRDAARSAAVPITLPSRGTRTGRRRAKRLRQAGIAAGVIGLLALGWWAPWKSTVPVAPAVESIAAASVAATPSPTPSLPTAAAPAPTPTPATLTAPSLPRDSVVGILRASALSARRQAVAAGATAVDLSEGDLELQAADAMASRSRSADAATRLTAASQRWTAAERAARDRVAPTTARTTDAGSAAPLSAPAAAAPSLPPAATPSETRAAPPRPATATESRPAIERVITAYELAIESGDLSQIRRAYPGLTAAQQANWEAFYRAARNLRTTFTITVFDPADDRATVSVDALYEYNNRSTSRAEKNALQLHLTIVRDDTGVWRLTTVK